MDLITSRDNDLVKQVCRLVLKKNERDESGLFVTEGVRLCRDAIASGIAVRQAFVTSGALDKNAGLGDQLAAAKSCFLISDSVAKKISATECTQGVFLVCEREKRDRPHSHASNARYLMLADIQDPGNFGSIIRTCEALGINGLIASRNCPELYSPKVLRASMGGAFRLPVWIADDMPSEIAMLQSEGVSVFAAALDSSAAALEKAIFEGACAVLLGNEGAGLEDTLINACKGTIIIPMRGRSDSLGVAAAAGIIAWEMTK